MYDGDISALLAQWWYWEDQETKQFSEMLDSGAPEGSITLQVPEILVSIWLAGYSVPSFIWNKYWHLMLCLLLMEPDETINTSLDITLVG